jgi:hypothetical protein
MSAASDWWWQQVFAWKKRTGWVDFHREVEAHGIVTMIDGNVTGGPVNDGDFCFNVQLDPGQEWLITTPDGRQTSEDMDGMKHGQGKGPSLHCEIPPWLASKFADQCKMLVLGAPVIVRGAWGFDGVHTGAPEWLEVLKAVVTHPPNWAQGWHEIHPVSHLEVFP